MRIEKVGRWIEIDLVADKDLCLSGEGEEGGKRVVEWFYFGG